MIVNIIKMGMIHIRIESNYYVPSSVSKYIDFISPTLRFPLISDTKSITVLSSIDLNDDSCKSQETSETSEESANTVYICPNSWNSLYHSTDYVGGNVDNNIQAVSSYDNDYYQDSNLIAFWDYFELSEATTSRYPSFTSSGSSWEGSIDMEWITAIGENIETINWNINDDLYFLSLLHQIDTNYNNDNVKIPLVVSISYGADEKYLYSPNYLNRVNTEFAKLGLMGITFFASSGDSGAMSNVDDTCETKTNDDGDSVSVYSVHFPASSPYVTAVGGTINGDIQTNIDDDTNEQAWSYSGGGFSNHFLVCCN